MRGEYDVAIALIVLGAEVILIALAAYAVTRKS